MLRSFRVENHKSFRDEAELLLLPAYDKTRPVVQVAGLFGANASGKSNLVDAMRWLQAAVRESYAQWEPGTGVPRTPFRLDPDASERQSAYCVELILKEGRYTYGVEVDDDRVVEEWLYTYPRSRKRVIFERTGDEVRLGSTIPDYRTRGSQLARQTRDNALLLSVAAHNDLAEVQAAYDWFRNRLRFTDDAEVAGPELLRRLSKGEQRPALVALIAAADLGISDITTEGERAPAVWLALRETLGSQELMAMLEQVPDKQLAHAASYVLRDSTAGEALLEKVRESIGDQLGLRPTLRFHHGESPVTLSLEDQSAGTRHWIGLVSSALDAISSGAVMVVDEVDASLHPHLTARLVNLFRDPEANPQGAQLLFSTHDPTLLDDEVLARDEIWFIEKEPAGGASRLYPLTDFHPRKNENVAGRYLAGGYGATPVLADYRFRRAVTGGRVSDAAA